MKKIYAIRGHMKSGTNWICNLLKLHPQINCVGEFHWERVTEAVINIFENHSEISSVEGLRDSTWSQLTDLIRATILKANENPEQPELIWAGDRTPGFIHPSIFPEAPFINIIRDGRDVAVSKAYHLFNHPEISDQFKSDKSTIEDLAKFQANPNFFKENKDRLLACEEIFRDTATIWKATIEHNERMKVEFPEVGIHDVKYEDAHADTNGTRRKMYKFFDVDPDLADKLTPKTRPGFKVEKPKHFFRKGSVGDWKNYFTDQNKAIFKEVAGKTLIELGYESDMNW